MTYDERWNTCGIEEMNMWPGLVASDFTFTRKEPDIDDILSEYPGAKVVTLLVKAPWGESRTVRVEGVEPLSVVIIDGIIDASYKKEAARGAP